MSKNTLLEKRPYKGNHKNNHNPNYKHGKCCKDYKNYCIDCDKKISNGFSKRCHSCAMKICYRLYPYKFKNHMKDKKHSKKTLKILSKIAFNCWKNKEYRNKVIKATLQSASNSPNKLEKVIINLLKKLNLNQYKYVGNGEFIINSFCPDFVNKKEKRLIEIYGCYWHKCKKCGYGKNIIVSRDTNRNKTYSKYGYKTLIIWEHEFKNINNLKNKILNFNNGN